MSDEGHVERIRRRGRVLKEDARELRREIDSAAAELRESIDIEGTVRRHPFQSVGIGFAAGFVLGGGLNTLPIRAALLFGARALVVPMVKARLYGMIRDTGRSRRPVSATTH